MLTLCTLGPPAGLHEIVSPELLSLFDVPRSEWTLLLVLLLEENNWV